MEEYNAEKLQEVKIPLLGDKVKGIVVKIRKDELSKLLTPEVLKKWPSSRPEDIGIQVTAQLETIPPMENNFTMTLPKDGISVGPNSNLRKWKKAFGNFPIEGQEVYLIADEKGRYQYKI